MMTALIVVLPFAFSFMLLGVVRRTEIYCREPWGWVFSAFIYGATMAVFLSMILNEGSSIFLRILGLPPDILVLVSAIVVAPLVEESFKSTGVLSVRSKLTEMENGIVYGSAVGLGFAATENLLYFVNAYYLAGIEALISTVVLRFLTSTFLHLGASGVVGYGLGISNVKRLKGERVPSWTPFLIAAMVLHALFNFLAYLPVLVQGQFHIELSVAVLFVEMAMVWLLFTTLRRKIKKLDRSAGCAIGEPVAQSRPPPAYATD